MTDKDMTVGGYRVPKNTPVQLPPYPMHLSSANFVRPLEFWPERWTQQAPLSPIDKGMLVQPPCCVAVLCTKLGGAEMTYVSWGALIYRQQVAAGSCCKGA